MVGGSKVRLEREGGEYGYTLYMLFTLVINDIKGTKCKVDKSLVGSDICWLMSMLSIVFPDVGHIPVLPDRLHNALFFVEFVLCCGACLLFVVIGGL